MIKPSSLIQKYFVHQPTQGQKDLFHRMDSFLLENKPKQVLLIKGYAGTGKTSVIGALVKMLPGLKMKYVLLAPTGRAAKVITAYSGKMALTIHKKIYKSNVNGDTGKAEFKRQKNYTKDTIFIVDEASMLSDDSSFGSSGLLSDLMSYVFAENGNRLVLIGDNAQLPPVGQTESPALDLGLLTQRYGCSVDAIELTEVMRQESDSGILDNATSLRQALVKNEFKVGFETAKYPDIYKMTGEKLEEGLRYAYDKYGEHNTTVILRSNYAAVRYNQYIRNQLLFRTEEIEVGDLLMVVRNNYFYIPDDSPGGFMANGDFIEVQKVVSFDEMHGFRFATLQVSMVDMPQVPSFEAKVLLDTLAGTTTSLAREDSLKLYESVWRDYEDLKSKKKINEALRTDPYLNALQVKYAYALTCHKSQGGQWDAVFVEQGYLKEEYLGMEYLRWLYTALTRASKELFLVNFDKKFFVNI